MYGEVELCVNFLFPFSIAGMQLDRLDRHTWRSLAFRCFFELDVRYLLLLFVLVFCSVLERGFS